MPLIRRKPCGAVTRKLGVGFEPLEKRIMMTGTFPGVPNVAGQFAAMQSHADALAFTLPDTAGAPDASISNHYQGIVRYPGSGTPVFYVTQKDDQGGFLHVVTMPTRDTDGERLGSNLQKIGTDTDDTLPPATDRWQRDFRFDGSIIVDGRPLRGYVHPGGMAIVDNILFVVMDTPTGTANGAAGGIGAIVLFDLGINGSRRSNPTPIQVFPLNRLADNVAVVKLESWYVLYVNGNGGKSVGTYRTVGTNLRANDLTLQAGFVFDPSKPTQYSGPTWPTGSGAHQSATFIRQSASSTPSSSDPLFLIAMRHSGIGGNPLLGDDLADLYQVTLISGILINWTAPGSLE